MTARAKEAIDGGAHKGGAALMPHLPPIGCLHPPHLSLNTSHSHVVPLRCSLSPISVTPLGYRRTLCPVVVTLPLCRGVTFTLGRATPSAITLVGSHPPPRVPVGQLPPPPVSPDFRPGPSLLHPPQRHSPSRPPVAPVCWSPAPSPRPPLNHLLRRRLTITDPTGPTETHGHVCPH